MRMGSKLFPRKSEVFHMHEMICKLQVRVTEESRRCGADFPSGSHHIVSGTEILCWSGAVVVQRDFREHYEDEVERSQQQ